VGQVEKALIPGIVMLGLKKLVIDRNPWVRKTVAGGLAKVYGWV
jgi:AP-3 complex subunit beta